MQSTRSDPIQPAADGYATIAEMRGWASGLIQRRRPDVVIGENYLHRWWVAPRNAFANVYLHLFLKSDDDRALHDHPWHNSSLILQGRYIEHTPDGQFLRVAGDFVSRPATALHRIELIAREPVLSPFTTGPKVRDWGFACPEGWVPWQEFCAAGDATQVGKGCAE